MKGKCIILPGDPNDANRDYLPEAIKGSQMVVNENGNNSQVYPQRLTEHSDVLLDGVKDTWFEYVPASYDGTKKVPLVISMHGGLMTGWGQAIYTSWTMVADREGFIVLFPNASERRFWIVEYDKDRLEWATTPTENGVYLNRPPENPDDNHDMNAVLSLIQRMKEKYAIDEGRIFMQGMSMGNMMTSQFARYHGNVLAGQAGSGGPTATSLLFDQQNQIINRAGPVASWQSRLELDRVPPHFKDDTDEIVRRNREYWKRINGCDTLPQIKIVGEDNFAFYQGTHANLVFRDVYNRDHGQTLDDAELVWDYLFSGVRREADGRLVQEPTLRPRTGDAYAIALAEGKDKAYVNNQLVALRQPVFVHKKLKYHGLEGDALVRGEYFMAPVSFIAQALGATFETSHENRSATLFLPDGTTLQCAQGSIGCVVQNEIHSMYCEAVFRNGELCLPIEWICKLLLHNHATKCNGVLYLTDHDADLSLNMANLIRDEVLQ